MNNEEQEKRRAEIGEFRYALIADEILSSSVDEKKRILR